jgi:hypothetical protein
MVSILGTTVGLMISGAMGGFMAIMIQELLRNVEKNNMIKGTINFIIQFVIVLLLGSVLVWMAQLKGWI